MSYRDLEGCAALVTGVSGVGRATALAREGVEVVALARREDLSHQRTREDSSIRTVPLDATNREAWTA